GEGTHTMLWIWYKTKVDGSDEEMVDVLHVEWCKAYARMRRWHEDIVLIEEEMRCTIEFGSYMAEEWQRRSASRHVPMNPALAEGLRAYAL
ncbi:hypothetical protein B0H14DRAFT_2224987, partial [Mycena olivaceomarginata]